MKEYMKPTIDIIELRPEERLAVFSSKAAWQADKKADHEAYKTGDMTKDEYKAEKQANQTAKPGKKQ